MRLIYLLSLIIAFLVACDSKEKYICDTYVNIEIDLNLPEFSDLNVIGKSIFVDGGCKGIIIYKSATNEYKIYDRNCSFEPALNCSFIDSINATVAYCKCCPSAFLIDQNGIPVNSPALLPLKKYNYTLNNQVLYIFN
tara:strand:- start:1095 stop:1508 length:414 start_codon:yes stop_codon:yes gene_type:complete